jgi:hypothetical protein
MPRLIVHSYSISRPGPEVMRVIPCVTERYGN